MKRTNLIFVFSFIAFLPILLSAVDSHRYVAPETLKKMEETHNRLMEWLKNINADAFIPGSPFAKDELILKDDSVLNGKVMDYGPYVCLVDDSGRRIIKRSDISKMTLSWGDTSPVKPDIPDLNVTYIERLPRYKSNHANVAYDPKEKGVYLPRPNNEPLWPSAGTRTTFKGHIVNKGPVASESFRYEWLIDGRRRGSGNHRGLEPGQEIILDFEWRWQDGPHTVTLKCIPQGEDFSKWNNSRTDRTDSLGFLIIASQSAKNGFDNALNMVESYSYEDWVQYHIQVMNFLFAASIHPGSPLGCFERVRIDRMVTIPDENYSQEYEKIGYDSEGYVYHEGKWGFSPWDQYGHRAAHVDWGLIHELGHQLGIIDYYTLDFWKYAIFARDKNDDLIDVGYSYPHTGMMRGHGPYAFTEVTAIALNWLRGHHRGHFGDYLFNLPVQCGIRILDFNGNPIPDAHIRIFRRLSGVHTADTGMIRIPEDPVFEGKTDEKGIFMLPNEEPPFVFTTDTGFTRNPSPFGDALVISDTGLMLIEIWSNVQRDIQFTDVTQFVIGRGRGYKDLYIEDIETILPGTNDTLKPPQITGLDTDGWSGAVRLRWANVPDNKPVEYKVYHFTDGLPFNRQYMRHLGTLNAEGPFALSLRYLQGWVTMTSIDREGNESAPAKSWFTGWRYISRFDINSRNEVIAPGLLRIDTLDKVTPLPMRSYRGHWSAISVAVGTNDTLYVLSRDYAGVSVISMDGREKFHFGTKGSGEGQLLTPNDIDLDTSGNVYIADTDNNRIAVFNFDGSFKSNIAEGLIEKPIVVETDIYGNIYVIESGKNNLKKISRTEEGYSEPVMFLVTQVQPAGVTSDSTGRIYLCMRAEPGILVVNSVGEEIARISEWRNHNLRGLSGLALDRVGNLVCGMDERGGVIRIPVTDILGNN